MEQILLLSSLFKVSGLVKHFTFTQVYLNLISFPVQVKIYFIIIINCKCKILT